MSTKPSFTVDAREFARAAESLTDAGLKAAAGPPIQTAIRRMVNVLRKAVRAELRPHRQTGRMASNVRTRVKGRGLETEGGVKSAGVGSNLIVGGVAPHRIAPGRVMPMWAGKGAFRGGTGRGIVGFARAVEHPGFPADPFFFRAVQRSESEFSLAIRQATDEMVKALAHRLSHKGGRV